MSGEFDRAAQEWVRRHYGVTPDLGSVTFGIDAAAYASAAWCNFGVSWTVNGQLAGKDISESAWEYDATELMRELVEIGASLTKYGS